MISFIFVSFDFRCIYVFGCFTIFSDFRDGVCHKRDNHCKCNECFFHKSKSLPKFFIRTKFLIWTICTNSDSSGSSGFWNLFFSGAAVAIGLVAAAIRTDPGKLLAI